MTKTMIRLGSTLLVSICMIAATKPASAAGPLVKVSFSGNGFSGWFEYDQSQAYSTPGVFRFQGSGLTHKICYTISSAACVPYSLTECEPYTITTTGGSEKTFELTTTVKATATSVAIVLPTGQALSQTSLPVCAAFPNTPSSGSTFGNCPGELCSRGISPSERPVTSRGRRTGTALQLRRLRAPRVRALRGLCVPAATSLLLVPALLSGFSRMSCR